MAGPLETFTVRGAAGFPAATLLAPIGSSSVCALSGNRKSVRLPVIRGLKIQAAYTGRSFGSFGPSPRPGRRGARIVCEAQDTAVEG